LKLADVTSWVEEHPTESIVIGLGGTLAVLWLLGFFSSSSNSSGSSNLASAYYAAEAQQAVVGGQIQMANINATASTAQMGLQTDAAVKINAANTGAAVIINGQNTGAGIAINQSNNDASTAQTGIVQNDQLLATYSNNGALVATNASNNAAAVTMNTNNNLTTQYTDFINQVLPAEFARMGSGGFQVYGAPGGQALNIGGGPPPAGTPAAFEFAGYDPATAQRLAALPQTSTGFWPFT
jgi:hypothetical protein